ncbi:MAG: (2Fe-2S)-binding protein [Acidobacteria bacterium]|nr:(2Fe-2S)-binding protein [Acidobacteriota bacterium]
MKFPDIFEPYEKLIAIEILGKEHNVPENNSLLRCFQFLSMENISYGEFCWNGECLNCQVWLDNNGKEKGVIACRTTVQPGMKIIRLAEGIELE